VCGFLLLFFLFCFFGFFGGVARYRAIEIPCIIIVIVIISAECLCYPCVTVVSVSLLSTCHRYRCSLCVATIYVFVCLFVFVVVLLDQICSFSIVQLRSDKITFAG